VSNSTNVNQTVGQSGKPQSQSNNGADLLTGKKEKVPYAVGRTATPKTLFANCNADNSNKTTSVLDCLFSSWIAKKIVRNRRELCATSISSIPKSLHQPSWPQVCVSVYNKVFSDNTIKYPLQSFSTFNIALPSGSVCASCN
jgi:hypothetical protein